jgi:UDP-N-acetylmuramate dehydrogenase
VISWLRLSQSKAGTTKYTENTSGHESFSFHPRNRLNIQEDIPLAPFTTLKIGGPARFFLRAESEADVVEAFDHAKRNGLPLFVLGGGSNIVVADHGFDGLVVQVAIHGVDRSDGELAVAAGEDWDQFVSYCVENDLAGIECLSGIPGYVGGTPVQNVGAYGQEVSETIVSVRCFDRKQEKIVELSNLDCGFSYRKSIFNSTERDHFIVLSVTFAFSPGGQPKIAYKDLRECFPDRPPTLRGTREAVLRIRRSKSMVIDESDPNSRSAGSFFKNPIVETGSLELIAAAAENNEVPSFPAAEGFVKVPAAWLIEQAGFHKGFRLGNAGISTRHSLALVNLGQATAAEIIALKDLIQETVERKFQIHLHPEPIFVGFATVNSE